MPLPSKLYRNSKSRGTRFRLPQASRRQSSTACFHLPWRGSRERICVLKSVARVVGLLSVCFCAISAPAAAGTNADIPSGTPENAADSGALRSYLQLQAQLRETQLALEHNRQETDAASARNAEAITARLQMVEQALTSQRSRELEAMQSANRWILIVAGTFAAVGFLAMLLTAYLQWRAVNRLAGFSTLAPASLSFGDARVLSAGGFRATQIGGGAMELPNDRLLGAIDRLEKRILELEHTTLAPTHANGVSEHITLTPTPNHASIVEGASAGAGADSVSAGASRIALLLAKGELLLSLDKPDEAVACFDEILALAPACPEALVKKGDALERLRRVDEAIDCYDRAIATDGSMTIAYLHKGGLFNRLERYEEALTCYEQALRSQETGNAA